MELRVAVHTLGCKLNQLESESLADAFRRAGARLVPFAADAELYLVNTCTVTSKAEQKARRQIRAALAAHPGAVVLATGCYAQLEPEALEALSERVFVLPGEEKSALLALAGYLAEEWQGHGDLAEALREWRQRRAEGGATLDPFAFTPELFSFHSRPALKVQDGCNNRCSYCRVCIARGPAQSLSADEALARLCTLEASGAREVVLAGVNLSQYRDGERDFPGLVRHLLAGSRRVALRISSYEPDKVDAAFVELFADHRVRPHVHLAVQSGSDAVLARMGRGYRRAAVLAAAKALRRVRPEIFLAADLIVGFPGETEADFAASAALFHEAGLAWVHAFPFSPRPGTAAFALTPRVPERVAGKRAAVLGGLARRAKAAYAERFWGAELEAVLERGAALSGGQDEEDAEEERSSNVLGSGEQLATAENYLKLAVYGLPAGAASKARPGTAIRVRLEGPGSGGTDARACFRAFL